MVAVIVAFITGGGIGYKIRDVMAKADLSEALEKERESLILMQQVNSDLVEANRIKSAETRVEYKYIVKKVKDDTTHQNNADCDLSDNTVRLLNEFTAADY